MSNKYFFYCKRCGNGTGYESREKLRKAKGEHRCEWVLVDGVMIREELVEDEKTAVHTRDRN